MVKKKIIAEFFYSFFYLYNKLQQVLYSFSKHHEVYDWICSKHTILHNVLCVIICFGMYVILYAYTCLKNRHIPHFPNSMN